jgi:hypothetical protein
MHRLPLKFVRRAEHVMNMTAYLPEDKDDCIERISHFKLLHAMLDSSLQVT